MKTLIVYASKYGTTRRCAERLADDLHGDAEVFDLRRSRSLSFDGFGRVIIGGPIYAGKIMNVVPNFCERHRRELLERTVALFISCLYEGETAQAELDEAFPAWLNAHAVVRKAVGGAIHYDKLSLIDRYLAQKVARVAEDIDTVNFAVLSEIVSVLSGHRTSKTSRPKTRGK